MKSSKHKIKSLSQTKVGTFEILDKDLEELKRRIPGLVYRIEVNSDLRNRIIKPHQREKPKEILPFQTWKMQRVMVA
jgi:hypothetical protein